MKKITVLCFFFEISRCAAQNERQIDHNNINWLQTTTTLGITQNLSIHLEYQWRRAEQLKYWQQSVIRVGTNFNLNEQVIAHIGYGWIDTHPYGDYPIASNGVFPEHRIYEQLTFRQPVSKWILIHRFRIEQRWLGKINAGSVGEIEDWTFLNRFRYQFRAQYKIRGSEDKQWYAALADEIFIGAGRQLAGNIFDQNRMLVVMGHKLNKYFVVEAGYINQTLQQGRRMNDKIIIQNNNGMVLTFGINLSMLSK